MDSLKQLRKERGFSQQEVSNLIGIPRRTYQRYEENEEKTDADKLRQTIYKILNLQVVDKTHGIFSVNEIGHKVRLVCEKYPEIECVYLFGSYARGDMTEKSDIDLFYVGENLTGLNVAGFYGDLCDILYKDIDLLTAANIVDNEKMILEIFKDGIKLYGKRRNGQI